MRAVFAETLSRTNRDILKRPVVLRGDVKWFDVLLTKTKENSNEFPSSTTLTPIQASRKKKNDLLTKIY